MAKLTSTTDGLVLGTNDFNVFTPDTSIQTAQIVSGLGGTDIFRSFGIRSFGTGGISTEPYVFYFIGGSGSTIYEVGDNSSAFIIEHPGDSLLENSNSEASDRDILALPNLSITSSDTIIFELDSKHLIISDEDGSQFAWIHSWRETENRIEEFRFADETLSYQQLSQNLNDYDAYKGNLTSASEGLPGVDNTNTLTKGLYSQLLNLLPSIEESVNLYKDLSDLNELFPSVEESDRDENLVEFYRFQNQQFDSSTYLFVGDRERDSILTDDDLSRNFKLEGDGNFAFKASKESGDNLKPFYRLQSRDISGTYAFVGEEEYNNIFAENSSQKDNWIKEGFNEEGIDIPDMYLYGAGTGVGTEFYRLQNNQNGTFLFANSDEVLAIENDPLLSASFTNQGIAFESLI